MPDYTNWARHCSLETYCTSDYPGAELIHSSQACCSYPRSPSEPKSHSAQQTLKSSQPGFHAESHLDLGLNREQNWQDKKYHRRAERTDHVDKERGADCRAWRHGKSRLYGWLSSLDSCRILHTRRAVDYPTRCCYQCSPTQLDWPNLGCAFEANRVYLSGQWHSLPGLLLRDGQPI